MAAFDERDVRPVQAGLRGERLLGEADPFAITADDTTDPGSDRGHGERVAVTVTPGLQTIVCKRRPIRAGMSFRVRSVGRWRDLEDVREESVDRLAFALAVFGAEATLRHVRRSGTVTLFDTAGRELLSYEGDRLALLGGPYLRR